MSSWVLVIHITILVVSLLWVKSPWLNSPLKSTTIDTTSSVVESFTTDKHDLAGETRVSAVIEEGDADIPSRTSRVDESESDSSISQEQASIDTSAVSSSKPDIYDSSAVQEALRVDEAVQQDTDHDHDGDVPVASIEIETY
jgi:hypothetical protein